VQIGSCATELQQKLRLKSARQAMGQAMGAQKIAPVQASHKQAVGREAKVKSKK
jgi:hypothetical protein